MDELTIVGWTNFDCAYATRKVYGEEFGRMLQLVCDEIAANRYMFSGEAHQNASTGVPVFSDGTCFRASMRVWGGLMARVYASSDAQYSYMDFYMSSPQVNLPNATAIDVEPALSNEDVPGVITREDRDIISQSLALDMDFFTTDKVLSRIYEKAKADKNSGN